MLTKANFPEPRDILLIKGHSAGIGDLLRGSAAWRALRDRFPESRLHLWFLTKNPASPSSELISRHHLLASYRVSDKRTTGADARRTLLQEGRELVARTQPGLLIDFEPNGFRTSLLTWQLRGYARGTSVGIAQYPLRRFFYTRAAPSVSSYARRFGMEVPLEYAERDFVALAALGIERKGTAIELEETEEGRRFRESMLKELGDSRPILGLNIGCGTSDAVQKRPDFGLLRQVVSELQRRHGFALVLNGAPYEKEINRDFLSQFQHSGPVLDLAGRTGLLELAGAIKACRLFISSDSGPYHMAVGLRVPTLAIFNRPNPVHYHQHRWVKCLVAPDAHKFPEILMAAEELLRS